MNTTWKPLYPWIKGAVLNLESVDSLLRQVVERIAVNYGTDCWLWAGLELGISEQVRIYQSVESADSIRVMRPDSIPPGCWNSNRLPSEPNWKQAIGLFPSPFGVGFLTQRFGT